MTKVLYVEDDRVNRLVIGRYLDGKFHVQMAVNSMEAIQHMQSKSYDVVLMDINLGFDDLDGIKLMKKLKELNPTMTTRFIAVTAFADEDEEQQILDAGFDAFHAKPVDKETMIAQIIEEDAKQKQ